MPSRNPARFQTFAEAFALAILQAEVDLNAHMAGRKPQEHALDSALAMLDMIQSKGIVSVEHYYLNTRGGALRHTAEALGLSPTPRALQDYLEGGTV